MKFRLAVAMVLVAAVAALAVGPKLGEKPPKLMVNPVNDDKDEAFDFVESIGDHPAVIAFLKSQVPQNQDLAMGVEQVYRFAKDRGLKALIFVPGGDDVKGMIGPIVQQYGIQTPVAIEDPKTLTEVEEGEPTWGIDEVTDNMVVFIKAGKVDEVMAEVTQNDAQKLQEALMGLFN